jgi:hypothetical protein
MSITATINSITDCINNYKSGTVSRRYGQLQGNRKSLDEVCAKTALAALGTFILLSLLAPHLAIAGAVKLCGSLLVGVYSFERFLAEKFPVEETAAKVGSYFTGPFRTT